MCRLDRYIGELNFYGYISEYDGLPYTNICRGKDPIEYRCPGTAEQVKAQYYAVYAKSERSGTKRRQRIKDAEHRADLHHLGQEVKAGSMSAAVGLTVVLNHHKPFEDFDRELHNPLHQRDLRIIAEELRRRVPLYCKWHAVQPMPEFKPQRKKKGVTI